MGLTALLPPDLLVPLALVETNSCSWFTDTSLLLRGRIEEEEMRFGLSLRGVVEREVVGIMIESASPRVCLLFHSDSCIEVANVEGVGEGHSVRASLGVA